VQRYDGAVAVVTGASSGLGRQLAVDLAGRGAVVTGIARRRAALAELEAQLRPLSPDCVTTSCDVADVDAFRSVLTEVEQRHGRIDVLVNAAGFERPTSARDADLLPYRELFETNFFAMAAGTLTVLQGMLARGSGIVVNVSSDHGRAPAPGTPAYSATKAAVSAFTESLAHETAGTGVRLHILYPGWVPTPLGKAVVEAGMQLPPRAVRRTAEQVSALTLDRMGGPGIEINAAKAATLAPVMRALAPPLYRRAMVRQAPDRSS
jgi:short-subunit dehydrogenase